MRGYTPRTTLTPRSSLAAPISQYLRIPFHAQGSTAAKVAIETNISGLAAEQDLEGTTTNVWATAGYLDVAADAGDNYVSIGGNGNVAMRNFMRGDTLDGVGGLLWLATVRPSNLTAVQRLWSHSFGAADGGYMPRFLPTEQLQLGYTPNGGSSQFPIASDGGLSTSADSFIAYYLDFANGTTDGYVNATQVPTTLDIASPPSLGEAQGLVLFGQGTSTTPINFISESVLVADWWLVRFEYDASELIPEIAEEYANYPRERLRGLAGA